ncbi:MAG: protocatechuate 3,4-dioxygenase subunit alpha [Candidatus Acidiferrales bacterium]
MNRVHTPSQTVGPFFHLGLAHLNRHSLVPDGTPTNQILSFHGRVYDADLAPVPDAQIELWQADSNGEYFDREYAARAGANAFTGFSRIATDDNGAFHFTTIKPGPVRSRSGGATQAPHISVTIFMRGLLRHLSTRIYFPNEPHNAADPVLHAVPIARRDTLIALTGKAEPNKFEWNVVLQGESETVFFDL